MGAGGGDDWRELGGVAGMIVCVPLFSVLYALLAERLSVCWQRKIYLIYKIC